MVILIVFLFEKHCIVCPFAHVFLTWTMDIFAPACLAFEGTSRAIHWYHLGQLVGPGGSRKDGSGSSSLYCKEVLALLIWIGCKPIGQKGKEEKANLQLSSN